MKDYVPVARKQNVIGCNIRPGFTPGSFLHQFGAGKNSAKPRTKGSLTSFEIKEAASAVLEKRGFINEPNSHDSTAKSPAKPGVEVTIPWPPQ